MSNSRTCGLLGLPTDILHLIIIEIIGDKHQDIEISIQRRIPNETYGKKWREGKSPNLNPFKVNNLMRCSRGARDLVLSNFEAYNTFYSDNTEGFQRLPKLLGSDCFGFIRKLDLRMDDYTKNRDELVFPRLLDVLCENLSNLQELKLSSEVRRDKLEHPFNDCRDRKHHCGITRQQQEVRALLRHMVHVVARHPLLRRLISFFDSGIIPEPGNAYCSIENFLIADAGQHRQLTSEDKILDATALSKIAGSELALVNLSDYSIRTQTDKPEDQIVSSIVPHKTGYFAPVIEQAYRTRRFREWRGWRYHDVDDLVRKCRELETRMLSISHQEQVARDVIDWHVENEPCQKLRKIEVQRSKACQGSRNSGRRSRDQASFVTKYDQAKSW